MVSLHSDLLRCLFADERLTIYLSSRHGKNIYLRPGCRQAGAGKGLERNWASRMFQYEQRESVEA